MKIEKINIYPVLLPFSADFSHSLRKRSRVKNMVVEVIAEDGKINGYGEGAPRSYVTGESQESVVESISNFTRKSNFPWELKDISQLWHFIDSLSNGNEHNSAICAIETALLDALGKSQNKNIIEYFPKDFMVSKVYYGATLPLTNKERILEICHLCKALKINTLRIKVGKNFTQTKETIEAIRSVFGSDYILRVDINGAWNSSIALDHIHLFNETNVKVVEQPIMHGEPDIADFAKLMQNFGIALMADESACTLRDVEKICSEGHYKMINVRLSKCGGFRKALRIIDYLRSNKIQFQIGCHLGESGILSAAGRVLCLLCRDALYFDGSYDEYLLKENITQENVTFGVGGEAVSLNGPGLGVKINHQRLESLSEGSSITTLSKP